MNKTLSIFVENSPLKNNYISSKKEQENTESRYLLLESAWYVPLGVASYYCITLWWKLLRFLLCFDFMINESFRSSLETGHRILFSLVARFFFLFLFFCLKIAGTDFEKKSPKSVWTIKEPYFCPIIATNLSKNYDFATRQHYLIVKCFSLYWEQNKKKGFKKSSF